MKGLLCLFLVVFIVSACSNNQKNLYTVEEANDNGDVVIELDQKKMKSTNLEEMIRFLQNAENEESGAVQIAIFQNSSVAKKKIVFNGTEFTITEEKAQEDVSYVCESVVDWGGQYMGNDCEQNGENVTGSVRLFEASHYDQNKAMQKVRFEKKESQ